MRAHKVHSEDTATYSLLQDRHKGMLLSGKPSHRSLPRGRLVLNNTCFKKPDPQQQNVTAIREKTQMTVCAEALAGNLKHHSELVPSFLAECCCW